jgi:hypothetical protein
MRLVIGSYGHLSLGIRENAPLCSQVFVIAIDFPALGHATVDIVTDSGSRRGSTVTRVPVRSWDPDGISFHLATECPWDLGD